MKIALLRLVQTQHLKWNTTTVETSQFYFPDHWTFPKTFLSTVKKRRRCTTKPSDLFICNTSKRPIARNNENCSKLSFSFTKKVVFRKDDQTKKISRKSGWKLGENWIKMREIEEKLQKFPSSFTKSRSP